LKTLNLGLDYSDIWLLSSIGTCIAMLRALIHAAVSNYLASKGARSRNAILVK